jgi:hypothetical protein
MQFDFDFEAHRRAGRKFVYNFGECCRELFGNALGDLALSESAVERVIVTDEHSFGVRVKEMQTALGRKHSYTDNEVHKAVGKTLPRMRGDGTVTSTVVIRDFVVIGVCAATGDGLDFHDWGIDQQLFANVVYHELGHCKDHFLRKDAEEKPVYSDRTFKSAEFNLYGGSMVLEELAACCHAAASMTPQVYQRGVREANASATSMLEQLRKVKLRLRLGQCNLVDMAVAASLTFWVLLREHAKLVGHVLGNPGLPQAAPALWKTNDSRLRELMDGFAEQLRALWVRYPDWTDETVAGLAEAWRRLAALNGYKFSFGPEGDALHFDR